MKKFASSKVPFIDLSLQYKKIQPEINLALRTIFAGQKFVLGAYGHLLEEKISKKTGAKFAIGLGNGSDALYLALLALGIEPGDEVITTSFSFFATAGAISRAGAVPVFVDIDPETFNLDPSKIEAKISKKTRAILPVHLFGLPCDMTAILQTASRYSIPVVEDAAQSFGALYRGRQTGSIGHIGCFSFYPTKNLGGAGDGGMVVTSSTRLAEKIKLLRNHGMRDQYRHKIIGINSRLDEIQAAVILIKLKWIDRWNSLRANQAQRYEKGLRGLPLKLPMTPLGSKHSYHLYSVVTEQRDFLKRFLMERGIGCGVYYPVPLHLQACYQSLGYKRGDLPVSEEMSEKVLSLPMFAGMTAGQSASVIRAVTEFFTQ